jgi:hypothetical protein
MTKKARAPEDHCNVPRRELLHLAERLRAGEDPERIAEELEQLAAKPPRQPPGRPKDPPAERAFRRLKRAVVSDAIYRGTFPENLYPADLALTVRHAKGKRAEADAVAAEILGLVGLRTIQAARKDCLYKGEIYLLGVSRRGKRMDRDAWEEWMGLMRRAFRI